MRKIEEKAYAKINISLDIINKREDGYHNLEMIMQTIAVYDIVTLEKTQCGISLSCSAEFVPNNASNLAWKAAALFKETYAVSSGVKIDIQKNIPVAAGLAGGSSDAAAVLRAMRQMFCPEVTNDELRALGLKLGADVPYCISGGTMLAQGVGEVLTPISDFKDVLILLIKPTIGISTPWAFKNYNKANVDKHPDTNALIKAIEENDVKQVAENMANVLECVAIPAHNEISEIKQKLLDRGAIGALMSGSGPSVFGIFEDENKLISASKTFGNNDYTMFVTKTV